MERDFLGLSSSVTVKEEITEDCKDSALAGGGGGLAAMHWSFSTNKAASAHPQVLSFKAATEEDHRVAMKTGYDSLTGLMTISSSEPFNPAGSHTSYSGLVQKNTSSDKQGGNYHGVTTTYAPQQFDSRQLHHRRSHEVRIFPNANKTNQNISITMTTPTLHHQSFLASGAGQNVIGSAGGVPLVAPISVVPPTGPVVGSTELRNASKTSSGPAQLTIFYGGSVCVYDDVSPEKAQAIMLLAGNGPSVAPKTPAAVAAAQVQATMPRPSGGDVFVGNNHQSHKSHNTTLGPGLPSPISVTSHVGPQSGAGSISASEKAVVNFMGGFASPPRKPEPPKVVTSLGSAPTSMITSAAPQARKASLARFLEKRKERATNASPYTEKQSPDQKASGSLDRNISTSSSAGASPLPAAS